MMEVTDAGLYCAAGNFWVDPWRSVPNAVITHAHADHARAGSGQYFSSMSSAPLLRHRLGPTTNVQPMVWREPQRFGDVLVSLHPAGHILGSAQVRIEGPDGVWVVSGDYKRNYDPSCEPFEVVACDTFITEATFALPVYRWPDTHDVCREIFDWWMTCRRQGRSAVLFCYALGKAQRILAGLTAFTTETVWLHGAVTALTALYRDANIPMLPTKAVSDADKTLTFAGDLILAPPSAQGSAWMKRFARVETGFASGWMTLRGVRRRKGYDRGFVVSDHADWNDLIRTVRETGASRVLATHGNTSVLVRYLCEMGVDAQPLQTRFSGEEGDDA
jgi:putative mRNA 3-end processing factor